MSKRVSVSLSQSMEISPQIHCVYIVLYSPKYVHKRAFPLVNKGTFNITYKDNKVQYFAAILADVTNYFPSCNMTFKSHV